MKELELYDIITLDDNSEYTILQIMKYEEKKYYLIAPVDKEEESDLQNLKIVEEKNINDRILLEEETNQEMIRKISNMFLEQLKEENKD